MNGKENIINKILGDAEAKCNEILAAAQAEAQSIAANAEIAADEEREALSQRAQSMAAEDVRNSLASAKLQAKKYRLQQMQQLIASCYQQALQHIVQLPLEKRKSLLARLLQTYAEQDDVVYICSADKDIVSQSFLDSFGKGLTLGDTFLCAQGGVLLVGKNYDKDLTLETLMDNCREKTETQVTAALFGE